MQPSKEKDTQALGWGRRNFTFDEDFFPYFLSFACLMLCFRNIGPD